MPCVNSFIEEAIESCPSYFDEKETALSFLRENTSLARKMELAQNLLRKVASISECPETWEMLVARHLVPAEQAMRILLPTHRDHVIHSANLYLLGVAIYMRMIRPDHPLLLVLADTQYRDAQAFFSNSSVQYDCHNRVVGGDDSLDEIRKALYGFTIENIFSAISENFICPTCSEGEEDESAVNMADFHLVTSVEDIDQLFRRRWGHIAIFHDCAYPLELATKQIEVYLKDTVVALGCPFSQCPVPFSITFNRLYDIINLPFIQVLCDPQINREMYADNAVQLIATNISHKLHVEYSAASLSRMMIDSLERGLAAGKLDHGVFSSLLMLRWLNKEFRERLGKAGEIGTLVYDNQKRRITKKYQASAVEFFYIECVDAASAIYLHNTKKYIDFFAHRPVDYRQHPYAWMLILCDQLQEWLRPSGETVKDEILIFLGAEEHKIILDEGPRMYFDFPENGRKINEQIDKHLRLFGMSFIKSTV